MRILYLWFVVFDEEEKVRLYVDRLLIQPHLGQGGRGVGRILGQDVGL